MGLFEEGLNNILALASGGGGSEEDAQSKLVGVSGAFSDALKAAVALCQTAAAFGKLDSDVIDD